MSLHGHTAPELESFVHDVIERGYCVLEKHFSTAAVDACREAFWPRLMAHLACHGDQPNRGAQRHFVPMPFDPPSFAPQFFFDTDILAITHRVMDERVVADQWGCDVPLLGSEYQGIHVDYQRPLFVEAPELLLPPHMLVVSFGLVPIATDNGPIELAPGTHRMPREEARRAVDSGEIALSPILLEPGDVLIRHPWVLHRGTPNRTATPRALVTIRYVRRWYADDSRDVNSIPRTVWDSLSVEQHAMMRFPVST